MSQVRRFQEYADAFEKVFENDDWSVLEPYFTEDAVYETIAGPPFWGEDRRAKSALRAAQAEPRRLRPALRLEGARAPRGAGRARRQGLDPLASDVSPGGQAAARARGRGDRELRRRPHPAAGRPFRRGRQCGRGVDGEVRGGAGHGLSPLEAAHGSQNGAPASAHAGSLFPASLGLHPIPTRGRRAEGGGFPARFS